MITSVKIISGAILHLFHFTLCHMNTKESQCIFLMLYINIYIYIYYIFFLISQLIKNWENNTFNHYQL